MENGSSRVALVTGAARGIGRGIALRLAADGLDVALNDIGANADQLDGVAEEIRGAGRRTATVVADVSVPDEVENMVGRVAGELGRLDVMVANAGIAQVAPLLEVTPEQFDELMAVNLRGVFLCYTAAARQMIRQGSGGKIIGAASIAAHKGFGMLGHYSASKFAVRGLTQAAAQEWAEHGITVNAYCPGMVDTAMWESIDAAIAEREGLPPGTLRAESAAQIPLGRIESPDDVANLVAWLASDESAYMTAQAINIEGGTEVH